MAFLFFRCKIVICVDSFATILLHILNLSYDVVAFNLVTSLFNYLPILNLVVENYFQCFVGHNCGVKVNFWGLLCVINDGCKNFMIIKESQRVLKLTHRRFIVILQTVFCLFETLIVQLFNFN